MVEASLKLDKVGFRLYELKVWHESGHSYRKFKVSFNRNRLDNKWFWTPLRPDGAKASRFPTQLHEWADDIVKVLDKTATV